MVSHTALEPSLLLGPQASSRRKTEKEISSLLEPLLFWGF